MATQDPVDTTYPTEDVTSIESTTDGKARQWLTRVQTNLWQFDASVKTRITWFQDQHYNALKLYEGAPDHYSALQADLEAFRKFLDDNGFPSDSAYYSYYRAYKLYLEGYKDIAKAPPITQADVDKGKIVGVCNKVDDGDTIFVNDIEIRLVGINTQEKGTFRGAGPATDRMKELVLGKLVTVYFDPWTPLEMYKRVLGAVYLGDGTKENLFARPDYKSLWVNYIMVDEGFAEPKDGGRNMYSDPAILKGAYDKYKYASSPDLVRLHVSTNPTHAKVYVDGKDIGKATPDFIEMTPGPHKLTLAADGCSSRHEDIVAEYGDKRLFYKLLPVPAAMGLLNIYTTPDDCDILLDDSPQGKAPLIGVQVLASASVKITAVKLGYNSGSAQILPSAGMSMDVIMDPLEKA